MQEDNQGRSFVLTAGPIPIGETACFMAAPIIKVANSARKSRLDNL